jgi:hypothetical protein
VPLHLAGHAAETEGGAGQAWIGGGPELLGSTKPPKRPKGEVF